MATKTSNPKARQQTYDIDALLEKRGRRYLTFGGRDYEIEGFSAESMLRLSDIIGKRSQIEGITDDAARQSAMMNFAADFLVDIFVLSCSGLADVRDKFRKLPIEVLEEIGDNTGIFDDFEKGTGIRVGSITGRGPAPDEDEEGTEDDEEPEKKGEASTT